MALTDKLTAIANAIRAKTGKTESLTLEQMPTEIESIATGGGSSDDVRYVTFRNEATGEEFVKPVATGDDCVDVVAKGLWAKPTKPSDAQYDYTFYGWGASDGGAADANILKNITEDKTVYAIFTGTLRSYTITWLDEDGSELHSDTWLYGTVPSYTPSKNGVAFDKWTPTPTAVTGEASYTASWLTAIASGQCGTKATYLLDGSGVLTISGTGAMNTYYSTSKAPWHTYKADIVKVVVSEGITHISNYSFFQLDAVTDIVLPDSVTSIGDYAIYYCTALTSITIPDGVTSIGSRAFAGDSALTSITIPDGVTSIGGSAFNRCTNLESVVIGSGVTSIGNYAFSGDNKLTSATFANTSGWWVSTNSAATSGDAVDVSNPATAAALLNSTYESYYWHRSA